MKHSILTLQKGRPVFVTQDEASSDARVLKGPGILHCAEPSITKVVWQDIKDTVISTTGIVGVEEGYIQYASDNIPEYTGSQLKRQSETRFHIPYWVENDMNAATLGEVVFSVGKGAAHVLILTTGTGIEGAVIIDRTIYHGCSGSVGEIGYMWVTDYHFQDIISTAVLVQHVGVQTKEADLNGRIIYARVRRGDVVCM